MMNSKFIRKHEKLLVPTAALLSALMLCLFFLVFRANMAYYQTDSIATQLREMGTQAASVARIKLYEAGRALQSGAQAFSEQGEADGKQVLELLQKLYKINDFETVYLADTAGHAVSDTGEQLYVAGLDTFKAALGGNTNISYMRASLTDGKNIITISVPVINGGTVSGVLMANYYAYNFYELLDRSLFGDHGSIYMVQSDGRFFYLTDFESLAGFDNAWDFLSSQTIEDSLSAEQLKQTILSQEKGYFEYTDSSGEKYTAYYEAVGLNGWYICCLVPNTAMTAQLEPAITQGIRLLLSCVVLALAALAGFSVYSRNRRKELETYHALEVNSLVGIYAMRLEETVLITYANSRFYSLCGCLDKAEFSRVYGNSAAALVDEQQRRDIRAHINASLESKSEFTEFEARVTTPSGAKRSLLFWGTFSKDGECDQLTGCVMDISSQTEAYEQVCLTQETFESAVSMMDGMVFVIDIPSRSLAVLSDNAAEFGFNFKMQDLPQSLINKKYMPKESIQLVTEAYNGILEGRTAACSISVRVRNPNLLEDRWHFHRLRTVYDAYGKPARAIGVVEDITHTKNREMQLLKKTQRDALTGLYNREATRSGVEVCLNDSDKLHAFILLDLDGFKEYNDMYGHIRGDDRLREVGYALRAAVRSTDIVGRLGGDEFIVFMKDISRREVAAAKAGDMLKNVEKLNLPDEPAAHVTICAGIALYPADGTNFNELYKNADAAMYRAKQSGRDRFVFFD